MAASLNLLLHSKAHWEQQNLQ